MDAAATAGWVVMIHCENDAIVEGARSSFVQKGNVDFRHHGASRPSMAEVEAVQRMILFSRLTGCPSYLVHLSVGESAKLVAAARAGGGRVVGETCPHFLVADASAYDTDRAPRFIHTPPLRTREDQQGLWAALREDGLHVVASDHCGYTLRQRTDYDNLTQVAPGIPGTETLLPLLFTYGVAAGRFRSSDLARFCCENPARIFGLHPRKGVISVGADADLVIYDPVPRATIEETRLHSAAGYSPFHGMDIQGRVATTILRGEIVYDGTNLLAPTGHGHLIPRAPIRSGNLPWVASDRLATETRSAAQEIIEIARQPDALSCRLCPARSAAAYRNPKRDGAKHTSNGVVAV